MVSARIAGLSHAWCLIGAAKQTYVQLSLPALPCLVQFQVYGELGHGGPYSCTAKGVWVEGECKFDSLGRETTSKHILKDTK